MDIPNPPEDLELGNIIDKLAQFVARNGPEFEHMTKQKQKDNPKFSFLFGGEYFNYYQYRVTTEQAILKQKLNCVEQQAIVQHGITQQSIQSAPWQQQQQIQQQIQDMQDQIRQSEQNLAAQNQLLLQQQQLQIDEVIRKVQDEKLINLSQMAEISLEEIERVLQPIIEQCTKDAISGGKGWIFNNASTPAKIEVICEYLLKRVISPCSSFDTRLHLVYLINDVLHHCVRKNAEDLKLALDKVVVPIFCTTGLGVEEEKQIKLSKLLKLWESHKYFEPVILEHLKNPAAAVSAYQAGIITEHAQYIATVTTAIQNQYALLQKQHQDYVAHLTAQIQQIQQTFGFNFQQQTAQTQQFKLQQKGSSVSSEGNYEPTSERVSRFGPPNEIHHNMGDPKMGGPNNGMQQQHYNNSNGPGGNFNNFQNFNQMGGPNYMNFNQPFNQMPFNQMQNSGNNSRFDEFYDTTGPPPFLSSGNGDISQFSAELREQLMPSVPYFDLPAGLMVPLVALDQHDYAPLDPADIRLPPPAPPSERLLAAVELFYSAPTHERPRNSEGWEQLGLYEFFKAKSNAKKQLDEQEEVSTERRGEEGGDNNEDSERSRDSETSKGEDREEGVDYEPNSGSGSPLLPTPPGPVTQINIHVHHGSPDMPRRRYRESKSPSPEEPPSPPPPPPRVMSPVVHTPPASTLRQRRISRSPPPYQRSSKSRSRSRSQTPPLNSSSNRKYSSQRSRSRSATPPPTQSRRRGGSSERERDRGRSPSPGSNVGFGHLPVDHRLDESNKGHQLLRKMGWGGQGLGAAEQGIQDPIHAGDVRDRQDQYKGVGISLNDPYESFRKSKGQAFINRMKARAEEMGKM